eukprot:jgi/Tetstr1/459037/TSEL_004505.t1
MPPRPVPEDALVDDAPGGATAASIAELEKRVTAQAEALEKRLAEQFEAATAALLARLAPPVLSPAPKGTQPAIPAGAPAPEGGEQGAQEPLPAELDALDTELEYVDFAYFGTQPAIPAGAPAPEGGEQGAQEPLPAELDALDTELEYVDFAYFGQVPPSGLEPPPRDCDEPRLWILTDDTAARGLAEQRGAGLPTKFWSVSPLEPSAAWSFSATPTDWLRDAFLAAGAQPPPSVTWASHRLRKGAASAASCYAAVLLLARPRPAATLRYLCKPLAFFSGKSCLLG